MNVVAWGYSGKRNVMDEAAKGASTRVSKSETDMFIQDDRVDPLEVFLYIHNLL